MLFSGEKPLNVLDNTECDYAIRFFKNNVFTKLCNIPEKNLNILKKYKLTGRSKNLGTKTALGSYTSANLKWKLASMNR